MKKIVYNKNFSKTIIDLTPEEILERESESQTEIISSLRQRRNVLLAETDIFVLPDRWEKYSSAQKKNWSDYRQALRDLPETVIDPANPVWPTKPE